MRERTRKRERERELEEMEPQNNCSLDEFGAPYTLGSTPRRPNSTYFCDPNRMSQRLMFLPVFQPLCSVRFLSISSHRLSLLSLIRFLDHRRPFRPSRSPHWSLDLASCSSRWSWRRFLTDDEVSRSGRVTCSTRQVFLFFHLVRRLRQREREREIVIGRKVYCWARECNVSDATTGVCLARKKGNTTGWRND